MNLIKKGKVCGASNTKFIKGNDSNKTIEQIKKNYHGENEFLNSIPKRYGRYFYVFKEISNSKIKFLKKSIIFNLYFISFFQL